jgi:hypothetical protein
MKELDVSKINKLSDKVADDLKKVTEQHIKELRDHEVSKGDTREIVENGIRRVLHDVQDKEIK